MASKPKVNKQLAVTVDTRNGLKPKLELEAPACPDPSASATANVSTVSTTTAGLSSGSARNAASGDTLDRFFARQRQRIHTVHLWRVFGGRHTSNACVDEGEED